VSGETKKNQTTNNLMMKKKRGEGKGGREGEG
jgi:hypothetical protein